MEARQSRVARRKPGAPRGPPRALPVPVGPGAGSCHWPTYTGHLSRDRVFVQQRDAALRLYHMGYFGKGTLSKHAPTFHRERTADDFDLHAHLLRVTDKVYSRRTFVGSVARGCAGPSEPVSLRSLACSQPFFVVRPSGPCTSAALTEVAASASLAGSDDSRTAARRPGTQSGVCAAAAAMRLGGEGSRLAESSACSRETADASASSPDQLLTGTSEAADSWERMDADVGFWFGSADDEAAAAAGSPKAAGLGGFGASAGHQPADVALVLDASGCAARGGARGAAAEDSSSSSAWIPRESERVQPADSAVGVAAAFVPPSPRVSDVASAAPAAATLPPSHRAAAAGALMRSSSSQLGSVLPTVTGSESGDERACAAEPGSGVGSGEDEDGGAEGRPRRAVIHEHLELLLEEAFFLAYGLGCLKVMHTRGCNSRDPSPSAHGSFIDQRNPASEELHSAAERDNSCGSDATCRSQALDLGSLWQTMCTGQPRFVPRYVAYHYLRSKGWVPRDGLRFGVDFVVYKAGPPYYHASYSVIVVPVDVTTLSPSSAFGVGRSWTWPSLAGVNRVTENVNKELLICYVTLPDGWSREQIFSSPDCLQHCRVHLVLMHRLVTSKEREMDKHAPGSPGS